MRRRYEAATLSEHKADQVHRYGTGLSSAVLCVQGSLFKIKSASGDLPKFVDLLKFSVSGPICSLHAVYPQGGTVTPCVGIP